MCIAALALLPAHQASTLGRGRTNCDRDGRPHRRLLLQRPPQLRGPHDFGQLFSRLCRALGVSALVLATGYLLMFPDVIVGGNLASYALLLTLLAALSLRVVVYVFAKRPPFSERVLMFGGGRFAGEVARQIETRPDLALRVVGCLTPAAGPLATLAMPDRRGNLPVSDLPSCRFRGIEIEEGTPVFERLTGQLAVEALSPSTLVFGDGSA
jgi:hypothetical protein